MSHVLTCVYCGYHFPADTPASGAPILTEHIKVCEKHPLKETIDRLGQYQNQVRLAGTALSIAELLSMHAQARLPSKSPTPSDKDEDRAIQVLIDRLEVALKAYNTALEKM